MFRYLLSLLFLILCLPQRALGEELRLAVLDFQGGPDFDNQQGRELLEVLTDEVRSGVLNESKGLKIRGETLIIMDRENTLQILKDQGKTAADCVGACEVELAKNIGANYVISGRLSKIETSLILRVKMHATEDGNLVAMETLQAKSKETLFNKAEGVGEITFREGMNLKELAQEDKLVFPSKKKDVVLSKTKRFNVPTVKGVKDLPSVVRLTGLDFEPKTTFSRVVIGVKGSKEFTDKKLNGDTIVVDIKGASVSKSLSRVLDTSQFDSPVKMVRAFKHSGGARVAISLKEDVDYDIRMTENGYIIVDIPILQSMQDEQRRAIDSKASFGAGSGSQEPSAIDMAKGFMFDPTTSTYQKYSGQKISIDLVNADIHSLFRLISHVSKRKIVTGDDVKGKVTVRMDDVPWDQALAAVLQSKGLGSQRFGNIIRVAPIELIKAEQQSAQETKRSQEELEELKLLVIPLNYAQASELESQVRERLSSRGTLQVDQRGNQLILKDSERRLAQIRDLIRHLDKQTPQVLIEARVVEASRQFSQMLGIEWGVILPKPSQNPLLVKKIHAKSNILYSATEMVEQNLLMDFYKEETRTFSLGSISGLINLDARLSAMETDGWGKIVSEPRIMTLDNKTAEISQSARVPFLSTSSGGTQVQFVEATLQLEVTPHITSDDQIFLALKVSNNRPDFSNLVDGKPAVQVKEAQTEVLIADGDTIVLGGVFAGENAFSQDKVSGLHKIPLLGYLFKNSSDQLSRNELLVFITPHLVTRKK